MLPFLQGTHLLRNRGGWDEILIIFINVVVLTVINIYDVCLSSCNSNTANKFPCELHIYIQTHQAFP